MPGNDETQIQSLLETIYKLQVTQVDKLRMIIPTENEEYFKRLSGLRESLRLPPINFAAEQESPEPVLKPTKGGRRTRKFYKT